MRNRVILGCLMVFLCAVMLTACGGSSSAAEETNSKPLENTAVSTSRPQEKQPYEELRGKTGEKKIAADEEQQLAELKEALNKLTLQYAEDENIGDYLAGLSSFCTENEKYGKSCIAPFVYLLGPSIDPILGIGFNYIGDEYIDMDAVEIDTNEYRYTYGSSTFAMDVQKDELTVLPNEEEKVEEMAVRIATEDDIDTLVDVVKSDKVKLTFARYNTAKPDFVECDMPEEDKQAITDALNAYYLYLNASEKVRAKALADLEIAEVN